MTTWQDYQDTHADRFVEDLMALVRIPSVSSDPAHAGDVDAAARWVANRLTAAGVEAAEVLETTGHPVVYGHWLGAGADQPTVLIYGHFDVQPADPFELWDSPPFEPEVREGRVYGRGASDDKSGVVATIAAVESMLATSGRLPVNLKFIFEGQEEIGSPDLPAFLAAERDRFACDMIYSADGGQWADGRPQILTGLRGLVALRIDVEGPSGDQHSGLHGGAIANPVEALAAIVASFKDATGRIAVEGFYDRVVEMTDDDRAALARVPFDEPGYPAAMGVPAPFGEEGFTTLERMWARPTLEINGMGGGHQGPGVKTVLPAKALANITCRLVADQDPEEIFDLIAAHVARNTPPGVTATTTRVPGSAEPFLLPRGHNASQIAAGVLKDLYGEEPFLTRSGGSIPVIPIFARELGVQTTMFAFQLDDERFHAPNEFHRIENFRKAQAAYCTLLERIAG